MKKGSSESPFTRVYALNLSEKQLQELKIDCNKYSVSLRTLILRAIYNELKKEDPLEFEYPSIDERLYDAAKLNDSTELLFKYIERYPNLSIEDLLYLRTSIDSTLDESSFYQCFMRLIKTDRITEKPRTGIENDRAYQGYIASRSKGIL